MPVAKHRPNFAELISHAALQRQRLIDRHKNVFREMSVEKQRKMSISNPSANIHPEVGATLEREHSDHPPLLVSFAIFVSTAIKVFVSSVPIRITRLAAIILAFVILTMHTTGDLSDSIIRFLYITDKVIDWYFIVFGTLSIAASYSSAKVRQMLEGKIDMWEIVRTSCCIDVITSIIAMGLGQSTVAVWFRMLRLLVISTFALQNLPHIDVLVVSDNVLDKWIHL